jgi:hypothetical protein
MGIDRYYLLFSYIMCVICHELTKGKTVPLCLAKKQRLSEDGTFPSDTELKDDLHNRKEISQKQNGRSAFISQEVHL